MAEFSLPAPWGAPDSELACDRCGKPTHHYGRRVTVMADEESDRDTGQIDWFCVVCGHKYEQTGRSDRPLPINDDMTELFDRH
jgi:hypothetical protein